MTKLLTEAQRQRYFHEGIVFPIRVLSADEARWFRAAYDLATHPRVLDAVEDVLGPNLLVWATELFSPSIPTIPAC
jgi:non-haem Fe2+, alpha-ketoglutarate-dependent halogenase